jgi:hypothetical protein
MSFRLFILSCWECPSTFQLFILSFHFTDLILGAAFVVAAVNAGRCLRCFSGKSGSDKPFKVAQYVIYDDAIIAVRISTSDNDINKNYNNNTIKARVRMEVGGWWVDVGKRL